MEFIIAFILAFGATLLCAQLMQFYRKDYPFFPKQKGKINIIPIIVFIIAYIFNLYRQEGTFLEEALTTVIVGALVFITCTDLLKMEIPDGANLLIFIVGIFYLLLTPLSLIEGLLSGFVLFVSFLAVGVISGALGGGDIKYAGAIGIWFSMNSILPFVYISVFSAFIYAIILMISFGRGRQYYLPFGPFLALGSLAIFFFF